MAASDAMLVFYKGSGVWQVLGRISTAAGSGASASPCIVADSRNNKWLFASNTTLTATVNEVIAKTSLGGTPYLGVSLSATLNFGSTGVNGLDTGSIAASTFYGLYWIYNPGSNTWATLASLSFTAPTLPSGYTAFALMGVVPTNASSQIVAGFTLLGRNHYYQPLTIASPLTAHSSYTAQSLAAGVPSVAVAVSGIMLSTAVGGNTFAVAADSSGTGAQENAMSTASGSAGNPAMAAGLTFVGVPLITAQTIYYLMTGAGAFKLYTTGFSI